MNRRHFLRSSVAAVVTVAAAPFIPAPVVIPLRHIYGRVFITAEMLAAQRGYNEYQSLLLDVWVNRPAMCVRLQDVHE